MQLSAQTVALYQKEAPELLDAVTSGEAEHIMKRDPATDYCVKFDAGWCGVHKQYGEKFLGDACHFFPRATRLMGDHAVMTLAPSCPEALRLMLEEEGAFDYVAREDARLPHSIKSYADHHAQAATMRRVHDALVASVTKHEGLATAFGSVASAVRSMMLMPEDQHAEMISMAIKFAGGRLPAAEKDAADLPRLVAALQGLIAASKATHRPRLDKVVASMCEALAVRIDAASNQVEILPETLPRIYALEAMWRDVQSAYIPVLIRVLQAQLSLTFFPYSGLGEQLEDKITIVGVRLATARLALMSAHACSDHVLGTAEIVDVLQPISRFLDHLADPTLSLAIYHELGWHREARMLALLGG